MLSDAAQFGAAREFLLRHRLDYEKAYADFRWPELSTFNWACDWFDIYAENNNQIALRLINNDGSEEKLSFAELSFRSLRVAGFLRDQGIARGDRILVMLPNIAPLWELMLAALRLGAVLVPTAMQATKLDLADRVRRAEVSLVVTVHNACERFSELDNNFHRCVVGDNFPGWLNYDQARTHHESFCGERELSVDDPLLWYFTSGTTALPKLVSHSRYSYPVGHLSTMYWIGINEGDIHQNISSPGWAKHAWSSFFAPFNAGATVLMHEAPSFNSNEILRILDRCGVNTLCAPPTAWRLLLRANLGSCPHALRELVSAGEPLNPEVIDHVKKSWGLTIRDGYGQTETTAQIGNSPGQVVKLGSMGRALPGYQIALLNELGKPSREGQIALSLNPAPKGLMTGYVDQTRSNTESYYKTHDEAQVDQEGYYFFIGRDDDVFKSSDYRISPFELESALIEHELVAEAAVVPAIDELRHNIIKAFVALPSGVCTSKEVAGQILRQTNAKLAAYQRIRRIEFTDLPKTISGKIRRVDLRHLEQARHKTGERGSLEFWLEDF